MATKNGDIASLMEHPAWVSGIVRRTARENSERIDISPAQKRGIPSGILQSQIWNCLEMARISQGPAPDMLGNVGCHLTNGEGVDQIHMSLSLYKAEDDQWHIVVHLIWDI